MRLTFDHPFPYDKLPTGRGDASVVRLQGTHFAIEGKIPETDHDLYAQGVLLTNSVGTGICLFDATKINLAEFRAVAAEIRAHATDEPPDERADRIRGLELNRRLASYLASFRLYLDYSEKRVKRLYELFPEVPRAFKALTARVFDGHFEYRFACKLRNYAQHFGLPVGHIRNVGTLDSGPPETKRYNTSICFDVAELLRDATDLWGTLGRELRDGSPLLDVEDTMRGAAAGLEEVHRGLAAIEAPYLTKARDAFIRLLGGTIELARERVVGQWEDHDGRLGLVYERPEFWVFRSLGLLDGGDVGPETAS